MTQDEARTNVLREARRRGIAAEIVTERGRELTARAHSRRIEQLTQAVRGGVGVRVIVDGRVASVEIARLLFVAGKIPRHEHARVRKDLLDYCERDTWAMVRLLEKLREIAKA
jgi:predicted Zn-dependent protease